jgi:16S rRNA A1518/A1519 N6-dimethyltransferase RsmA/KsgA/DIM1 with predicted DNA glycosylase/AP lyase activity
VLDVPPEAFDPPPRVDSAVVRMCRWRSRPRRPRRCWELVTVAFSQRRKLLRHTLGRWLERAGLRRAGFDLQRRAEEVPVEESPPPWRWRGGSRAGGAGGRAELSRARSCARGRCAG